MSRSHKIVRARRSVFLGCEGESEQAYCQVLSDVLRPLIPRVHLAPELIGEGAGDPLAKIRKAIKKIEAHESKRPGFMRKAVLIDADLAESADAKFPAEQLAGQHGIRIIWQAPCHEAFLLRHLPGCETLRPPSSALAKAALMAKWPAYDKPMSRMKLALQIDLDCFSRAMRVEADLQDFLIDIGYSGPRRTNT